MSHATVSEMADTLVGSEILRIAADIQELIKSGRKVVNFTVGDFDPKYFPIPEELKKGIIDAIKENATNYPPSSGVPNLREAVAKFYTREFGIPVKAGEVLVAGGARPLIYTIFTTLVDPGDTVVYPVPSWNNNHYCHLARAKSICIPCHASQGFLPTAKDIKPHIKEARLLCLNSPLNPSGTAFRSAALLEICQLVVDENENRKKNAQRPLYLMFDQIYWLLTHGKTEHLNPVKICPEIKPYVIFVDGISKYFCGTGLRVGWSLLPEALVPSFSNVLGHVGAWAPKPEQIATANFLNNVDAVKTFVDLTRRHLQNRLDPLFEGLTKMKEQGLPVDVVRPQGAIYMSLQLKPKTGFVSNEDLRKKILQKAGVALVPFQAFGLTEDTGWFRISVGAVSEEEIPLALKSIESFLRSSP